MSITVQTLIDSLRVKTLEQIEAAKDLPELERVATVCKTIAEGQNQASEAETRRSSLRQEGLKNWAQILVPFLSVLTLGVTLFNQTSQQRETERSRQDTAWRNAIDEFKSSASGKTPVAGVLAQIKLKPFLDSPDYGKQANDLAVLVLPRLSDPDAFEDLFDAIQWKSPNDFARVLRALNRADDYIRGLKDRLPQPDTAADAAKAPGRPTQPPNPVAVAQAAHAVQEEQDMSDELIRIETKLAYVCNKLGAFVRSVNSTEPVKLDLHDGWLLNCDLSKVNLKDADLSNVSIRGTNVMEADFRGVKFSGMTVAQTAWWHASAMSSELLQFLLDAAYPGSDNQTDLAASDWPSKEQYLKDVDRLCDTAKLACPHNQTKYEPVPAAAQ